MITDGDYAELLQPKAPHDKANSTRLGIITASA
jgi:hypothetical protein